MLISIWTVLFGIFCIAVFLLAAKRHGWLLPKGVSVAIPQLPYLDKDETVRFYTSVLGFTILNDWDGYMLCKKDQVEVHLWKCDLPDIPKNTGCYLRVHKNIRSLYKIYEPHSIMHEQGKLEMKPWGMLQFTVVDNSGNLLHFGQEGSE
ncbi:MAG: VOC family protein [Chitinophagia bacterium]|jgi:catechol 2,3-dioxygenase-like lactoylglutathione lyase family enzyme